MKNQSLVKAKSPLDAASRIAEKRTDQALPESRFHRSVRLQLAELRHLLLDPFGRESSAILSRYPRETGPLSDWLTHLRPPVEQSEVLLHETAASCAPSPGGE